MSIWFKLNHPPLGLTTKMRIDLCRLQCFGISQKYQIQRIENYLPFAISLTIFGLKTKDRHQLLLPGAWNSLVELDDLFDHCLKVRR